MTAGPVTDAAIKFFEAQGFGDTRMHVYMPEACIRSFDCGQSAPRLPETGASHPQIIYGSSS